jgi:aryl-alcohol dehydrogenase-like predicted oxidoreductase/enamine deaminase RidA (YjgF/YER057c/UK114 family)
MKSKLTLPQYQITEDLQVPRIITGLWQVADMERGGNLENFEVQAGYMKNYASRGFNAFDMADHYGSAEEITGVYRSLYQKEQPIQAFTKWVPVPGQMTSEKVREAIEKSLKKLQTEQIDLLQFHAWLYADPAWLDALHCLQELKTAGLIRHLGVTNFDTAHLKMALSQGIEIATNQVCFSLLDRRAAGAMSALCESSGVRLFAFGTLAGGFLSEKWLNQPEPELTEALTWSQMKYKRFINTAGGWKVFQGLLSVLDRIASSKNVSIANVASRFILEQPAVASVIIGARLGERNHSEDNMRLFSFDFSADERAAIEVALGQFEAIPGDCGDEYRKPPFLTAAGDLSHHFEDFPSPYPGIKGEDGRIKALSGTVWEDMAGFSRAVRKGKTIAISGTTATHNDQVVGAADAGVQTHFIIDKLEGALLSLGSSLKDVIRTRIFVRNMEDWEAVARAHGERFKEIQPANTLVQASLVGDEYLVEIEADAIVS